MQSDQMSYTSIEPREPQWITGHLSGIAPLVEFMRKRVTELPPHVIHLTRPSAAAADSHRDAAGVLQSFLGRTAIVSAVPMGPTVNDRDVVRQRSVPHRLRGDDSSTTAMLADFGNRLQLTNLHEVGQRRGRRHGRASVHDLGHRGDVDHPPRLDAAPARRRTSSTAWCRLSALRSPALRCSRVSCCATCAAPRPRSPRARTALRYLAMHDPLCGLPNRIFFGERLEAVDRRGQARRVAGGGVLHRPRPLQGRQRHARPSGRRRADPQRDAAARRTPCAATIWWRGSAATNSRSSPPVPSDHATLEMLGDRIIATAVRALSASTATTS